MVTGAVCAPFRRCDHVELYLMTLYIRFHARDKQ